MIGDVVYAVSHCVWQHHAIDRTSCSDGVAADDRTGSRPYTINVALPRADQIGKLKPIHGANKVAGHRGPDRGAFDLASQHRPDHFADHLGSHHLTDHLKPHNIADRLADHRGPDHLAITLADHRGPHNIAIGFARHRGPDHHAVGFARQPHNITLDRRSDCRAVALAGDSA